jgi:hypothetical protein
MMQRVDGDVLRGICPFTLRSIVFDDCIPDVKLLNIMEMLVERLQFGCGLDNVFKVTDRGEFPTSMRLELREGRGTSLDETHGTSLKCQRITIPFTHTRRAL